LINLRSSSAWKFISLIFLLAINLVWLQGCGNKNLAQDSCNFIQNSEGQRVSWGGDSTVNFYVDASVPTTYLPVIQRAADTWNTTIGHQQIVVAGWTNKAGIQAQDGMNVIYWKTDWDANQPSEQARTTIYWSSNRMNEADIMINAKNFKFSIDTPAPGEVDLQSLLVHEFGHALGLKHTTATSVMVKTLDYDVLRRAPQPFDVASIRCEY